MFCEESLGKIKFKTFPKRVGSRILSLEIVDYFGTSEHYWVVEKTILISKTAMVGFCKLSLYALVSCDEMRFIFGDDWNDVPCKSLVWSLAMMWFLWNWGPWIFVDLYTPIACVADVFPVVANTRTKSIQRQVKSIDVDEVGSKKPLASKTCFV